MVGVLAAVAAPAATAPTVLAAPAAAAPTVLAAPATAAPTVLAAPATAAPAILAAPAAAAPAIVVTTTCAYSGGRFAISGTGFEPRASVALDVMATSDPLAGAAIAGRAASAGARGTFVEILDVPPPPATDTGAAVRAVRARPSADGRATPAVLASASLRSVSRGVRIRPRSSFALTAGASERWRLTGLPEGTALFAHYRRAGRTVARRSVGAAVDPCGRLDFVLPVLPRRAGRGAWEVWLTADRAFRRPREGVFVRRRLTAAGPGSRARVRAGALTSRLVPSDPRFSAPATNGMAADASQIGLLSLTFVAAEGATVEFLERVGDRLVHLGRSVAAPGELLTGLQDATTWSCERPERRFVATATRPDGALALATYSVRTPSCVSRFTLSAPPRAAPGALVRVRIVDRWGIGAIAPALCVTPPHRPRACHAVALVDAVTVATRRFRATARGDWRVQLLVGHRRVASAVVRIGGGRGPATRVPTVLATGDSTVQGIDGFLADELGETASVVSDVRIGTGISRAAQGSLPGAGDATAPQWALLAAQQTRRLHQRATVVSLGANEGFPMTTPDGTRVACCDAPWTAEYGRRTRLTMQAYPRAGAERVLWLTLPLPRSDARRAITSAVNAAIVTAATGVAGVRVLRMDLVFTPDGYRDVIRYRGRDVDVRDVDGVHLNVAGTAIAAKIVAKALRER
ncbi:MAG: uncharacterized protein QOG94_2835 [Solirubrobacteraceae bacterium]|nr:uncharacterized protein [Solirubrobacteraceae bacterium]